jgi:hypothetical protein
MIFQVLVDRKNIFVSPTVIAQIGPMIEVLGRAPDIDHSVEAARPAQHLSARPGILSIMTRRVGFGFISPIPAWVAIVEHYPR